MGAPISSYDLLKPLSDPSKSWDEFDSMREALKDFNLFAFIIHDPEEHSDFDQKMGSIFDRLDYLTGEKLLFFTLIDPPKEWLQRYGRQREYMKYLGNGKALVLPNPENATTSTDKELTAFSLAKSLNIPIEMLPCIVITHDFRSSHFDWVRTCEDHIEEQLTHLGHKISRVEDRNIIIWIKKTLMQEINLCEGIGSESLEDNLARALTDVLSFIIDSDAPEVKQQVEKTITGLRRTLKRVKSGIRHEQSQQPSDLYSQLDSLCEKIVASLVHLNIRPEQDTADFIHINMTHLEVDSRLILRTAHRVNDFLMNSPTRMIDYTPVAICLAKVFEREINLSVVHWIRESLGVELPTYFNQHQQQVSAIFSRRGIREIDFNRGGPNNKWIPPAIGESQIAYRRMAQNMMDWLPDPVSFLENWETIRKLRNQTAHTQYVGEGSVLHLQNTLNQLAKNNIFESLFKMKKTGEKTGFQLNP